MPPVAASHSTRTMMQVMVVAAMCCVGGVLHAAEPELAAMGAHREGAPGVLRAGGAMGVSPRVLPPLRPEESLAKWRFELPIPIARQIGDKTNCGPTAAAMALGAYQGVQRSTEVRVIRDLVGEWTWQAFPARQMRLPGYDAGMTTRHMMQLALDRFEPTLSWKPAEHSWLPLEAWSVLVLKQALSERRPLVVLAEAKTLWGLDVAGLHWVVVRGIDRGQVVFNDPADGTIARIALDRFWHAWRLPDVYRSLPMVSGFEALMPDRSLPVVHVAATQVRPDALEPL